MFLRKTVATSTVTKGEPRLRLPRNIEPSALGAHVRQLELELLGLRSERIQGRPSSATPRKQVERLTTCPHPSPSPLLPAEQPARQRETGSPIATQRSTIDAP